MSHWQAGKIELKCSMELLVKALEEIKPEWKKHIHSSEQAKFKLHGWDGTVDPEKYNIFVAGAKNPNYQSAPSNIYGDLGLLRKSDDTWGIKGDFSGIRGVTNFEGALKASVAALKVKKIAQATQGMQITSDTKKGKKRVIRMTVPVDQQYKI
jgi:hypothetical protein